MSGSIELGHRNKRHGAPAGGTGHLAACPFTGGVTSWLRLVTARRPKGHETRVRAGRPHDIGRTELCACAATGLNLESEGGEKKDDAPNETPR
jgi:hypothetical protein